MKKVVIDTNTRNNIYFDENVFQFLLPKIAAADEEQLMKRIAVAVLHGGAGPNFHVARVFKDEGCGIDEYRVIKTTVGSFDANAKIDLSSKANIKSTVEICKNADEICTYKNVAVYGLPSEFTIFGINPRGNIVEYYSNNIKESVEKAHKAALEAEQKAIFNSNEPPRNQLVMLDKIKAPIIVTDTTFNQHVDDVEKRFGLTDGSISAVQKQAEKNVAAFQQEINSQLDAFAAKAQAIHNSILKKSPSKNAKPEHIDESVAKLSPTERDIVRDFLRNTNAMATLEKVDDFKKKKRAAFNSEATKFATDKFGKRNADLTSSLQDIDYGNALVIDQHIRKIVLAALYNAGLAYIKEFWSVGFDSLGDRVKFRQDKCKESNAKFEGIVTIDPITGQISSFDEIPAIWYSMPIDELESKVSKLFGNLTIQRLLITSPLPVLNNLKAQLDLMVVENSALAKVLQQDKPIRNEVLDGELHAQNQAPNIFEANITGKPPTFKFSEKVKNNALTAERIKKTSVGAIETFTIPEETLTEYVQLFVENMQTTKHPYARLIDELSAVELSHERFLKLVIANHDVQAQAQPKMHVNALIAKCSAEDKKLDDLWDKIDDFSSAIDTDSESLSLALSTLINKTKTEILSLNERVVAAEKTCAENAQYCANTIEKLSTRFASKHNGNIQSFEIEAFNKVVASMDANANFLAEIQNSDQVYVDKLNVKVSCKSLNSYREQVKKLEDMFNLQQNCEAIIEKTKISLGKVNLPAMIDFKAIEDLNVTYNEQIAALAKAKSDLDELKTNLPLDHASIDAFIEKKKLELDDCQKSVDNNRQITNSAVLTHALVTALTRYNVWEKECETKFGKLLNRKKIPAEIKTLLTTISTVEGWETNDQVAAELLTSLTKLVDDNLISAASGKTKELLTSLQDLKTQNLVPVLTNWLLHLAPAKNETDTKDEEALAELDSNQCIFFRCASGTTATIADKLSSSYAASPVQQRPQPQTQGQLPQQPPQSSPLPDGDFVLEYPLDEDGESEPSYEMDQDMPEQPKSSPGFFSSLGTLIANNWKWMLVGAIIGVAILGIVIATHGGAIPLVAGVGVALKVTGIGALVIDAVLSGCLAAVAGAAFGFLAKKACEAVACCSPKQELVSSETKSLLAEHERGMGADSNNKTRRSTRATLSQSLPFRQANDLIASGSSPSSSQEEKLLAGNEPGMGANSNKKQQNTEATVNQSPKQANDLRVSASSPSSPSEKTTRCSSTEFPLAENFSMNGARFLPTAKATAKKPKSRIAVIAEPEVKISASSGSSPSLVRGGAASN